MIRSSKLSNKLSLLPLFEVQCVHLIVLPKYYVFPVSCLPLGIVYEQNMAYNSALSDHIRAWKLLGTTQCTSIRPCR